jgi:ClpP class serine protease
MTFASLRHQSWSITPEALRALSARADSIGELVSKGIALPDHSRVQNIDQTRADLSPADRQRVIYNGGNPIIPEIANGVATIEIVGDIIARAPWWAKAYLNAIDPFDLADAFDALAADAAVTKLVLEVDCCGGTTSGTGEAAAALTRFQAAGKTVEVHAAGTLASAAYWLVSNADRIIATATTRVGSLGTMQIMCDETVAMGQQGIRLEIVGSTPLKGLGMDGAISAERRAQSQRLIDGITAVFRDAVAAGRGLAAAKLDAVFTGEVWLAGDALALGLIDAVGSPADENDEPTSSDAPPVPQPPPLLPAEDGDGGDGRSTSASTEPTPPPPPNGKDHTMDAKLQAALAALTVANPTLAAALVPEAIKPGQTAAGLESFAAAQVAKAKDEATAAEIAGLKAKAAEFEAKAIAAETARVAAETAKAASDAALAKLSKHVPGHTDPGPGQGTPELRRSTMSFSEKGEYQTKHGIDAYNKLPL